MDKKKLFLITGGVILLTIFVAVYYVFNKSDEFLDDFDSNVISTTLPVSEKVQDKIFVDVKGAVKKPGVYEMNSSDRVVDQTTPNMIQRISGVFERKPLISRGIIAFSKL